MKHKITKFLHQHPGLIKIMVIAIVSRLLILLLGMMLHGGLTAQTVTSTFDKAWLHWDGVHYLNLVNRGYDTNFPTLPPDSPICNMGTGFCQRNFAFFPVLPLSVSLGHALSGIDSATVGILLSNVFFVLAVGVMFQFVKEAFDEKLAWWSSLFLLFFPWAYVFSGFMTEGLFLLLLVSAYYAAWKKHWLLAGLLAAVLSATRIVGVLIGFSFLLLYLEQHPGKLNLKRLDKRFLLALLLTPVGIGLFMLFLQHQVGDPLAFIHIQSYWNKPVINAFPLFLIFYSLVNYKLENSLIIHLYNLAALLVTAYAYVASSIKKLLPWSLSTMLLWILAPMTAGTLLALPRYCSVLFPVYIIIAKLTMPYPRLQKSLLGISALALLYFLRQYSIGSWMTV